MADNENTIDEGCGCPNGDDVQTHNGTGLYLHGEAACGRPLTMGCEVGVVNAHTWEEYAKKLECYLDKCCKFFDLTDTPDAGACGAKSIFYAYQDSTTQDRSLRCTDLCTLLTDLVENGTPCTCDCECDEECECDGGCKNPRGDKLVGASENDPNPGYLIDKLSSDGCLDFEIKNGGTQNETVHITCNIEYSLIDTVDGPGAYPTCPTGNANIVQTSAGTRGFSCPECVPIGTLRLTDSISEQALVDGIDGFRGVGGLFNNEMTSCANVKNVEYDNGSNEGSFASGGAVQITQEGRYDMEFSVPTRWSHGIRTLRMQLTALAGSTNPGVIVEDTIEGPDFETEDYENSYAPNSAATNNAAVHGALVRGLSRYTFSGSRMVYLYAGDCVALILKYSATDIDEEVHKDGINISIHGSNDNGVTNGVGPGAHISRHYRPSLRYPVV